MKTHRPQSPWLFQRLAAEPTTREMENPVSMRNSEKPSSPKPRNPSNDRHAGRRSSQLALRSRCSASASPAPTNNSHNRENGKKYVASLYLPTKATFTIMEATAIARNAEGMTQRALIRYKTTQSNGNIREYC